MMYRLVTPHGPMQDYSWHVRRRPENPGSNLGA